MVINCPKMITKCIYGSVVIYSITHTNGEVSISSYVMGEQHD